MRVLTAIALLAVCTAVPAAEYIERFQSDIQVLSDGSMEVIETITVNAQGKSIRRGIYRDFPTVYRDRLNNRVQVRFEVMSVRRNGKSEPWFEKSLSNGVRGLRGKQGRERSPWPSHLRVHLPQQSSAWLLRSGMTSSTGM